MKTIGEIIKDARVAKKYSLKYVEGITKIKSCFVDAIETERWELLPPFPTVLGFVKSLSDSLDIDSKMSVAVLKRDYPPKNLRIEPKPDVEKRVIWGPRSTFFLGIGVILVLVLGYLGFQYYRFVSPPKLFIESPKENQIVIGDIITVFGSTDSDAKVVVNNQPVMISPDGNFSVSLEINKETKEITIAASSRSGKSTVISRKILVK